MDYHVLSDNMLMSLTKRQLVEHVRCYEHNWLACEERLEQQYQNTKDWQPVVHCKDCEHCIDGNCDYHSASVLPTWFCWEGTNRNGFD